MNEVELREWKIKKKTEAYEDRKKGEIDADEYLIALKEIDMIQVVE